MEKVVGGVAGVGFCVGIALLHRLLCAMLLVFSSEAYSNFLFFVCNFFPFHL